MFSFFKRFRDPHPAKRDARRADEAAFEGVALAKRLRTIEILSHRIVSGIRSGNYNVDRLGPGWDQSEARPYEVGDDVRFIDWSATARTGTTQLRPTLAERELLVGVLVDASHSMMFGTSGLTKYELSLAVAGAVSEVSVRGGNPVALARISPDGTEWFPVVSSPGGQQVLLRRLAEPVAKKERADVAAALWGLVRVHPRCRTVILCSDLRAKGIEAPLRALGATRRVVVIEPYDRRERELTAVGQVALRSGKSFRWVDTSDEDWRKRYAAVAKGRADARAAMVRSCGARHVTVPCEKEWLDDVARALTGVVARSK